MIRDTPVPRTSSSTDNRIWARSTSALLLLVGLALSLLAFVVVASMPELPWDEARDAQLRATYDNYRETGSLVIDISPASDGSAGRDDDAAPLMALGDAPGSYVVASLMSHVTQSPSPYPGLTLFQALVIALPLIWLPTATARVFRRARAGYALVLLPPLTWLLNNGTILLGTDFGLPDAAGASRLPTLPGIAASLCFLALSLLLLLSTFRLRPRQLVIASALLAVLSGIVSLFTLLGGLAAAAAVGVIWMRAPRGRRVVRAVLASLAALAVAVAVFWSVSGLVEERAPEGTSSSSPVERVVDRAWEDLYLGLSYPEPVTGQPSAFDVIGTSEFALSQARAVDPEVVYGSSEFDAVMRELYADAVASDGWGAVGLYFQKFLFVVKHYGAMIGFVVVGFIVAGSRRAPQQRPLAAALAVATPTVVLGFLPPVLGIPSLPAFTLLSAALGLLTAVALGGLVWSITSMPSHFRSVERSRLSSRSERHLSQFLRRSRESRVRISVIVPTRNGEDVLAETLKALSGELTGSDEIIVVENGSTDGTVQLLTRISEEWGAAPSLIVTHSQPGLGEALRTGALASHGRHLLLTADDLPFGFSDLEQFRDLPEGTVVAVGSKAHPLSRVTRSTRRTIQSRIFRFLRQALLQSRVGDSQGTLWVDGDWGREFAHISRESGLMWTTELVLAAEQQGITVAEVPVSLSTAHETGSSRFRLSDAWQSFVGFTRLAVYKDDYNKEDWVRSTRPSTEPAVETSS